MRSFKNKYNRDRHAFNVHGTSDDKPNPLEDEPLSMKPNPLEDEKPNPSEYVPEPLFAKPNPSEETDDADTEGTEDADTEDADTEDADSADTDDEGIKPTKKRHLSESESEEDSDEELEFNNYDILVANELIEMAGEEGHYGTAWLRLLDMNHWLKKSIMYENIRSAAKHFDDIDRVSRTQLMKKAVAFRMEDINEIIKETLRRRKRCQMRNSRSDY